MVYPLGLIAPTTWSDVGLIWIDCIVWIFIEDWAKLAVYSHLVSTPPRHRNFLCTLATRLHPHG